MSVSIGLSDVEWQVMKALWDQSDPTTAARLTACIEETSGWHLKTVRTMLTRLERKGAVRKETIEGVYRYAPAVTQADCCARAAESFVDRVFDGSLTPMVALFTKRRRLSAEDRAALEALLDSLDAEQHSTDPEKKP